MPGRGALRAPRPTGGDGVERYIVQRYISSPRLVGGRKYDLRLYVLVTSWSPLTAWMYRAGFARFSHTPFADPSETLGDLYRHITNVAVQKSSAHF